MQLPLIWLLPALPILTALLSLLVRSPRRLALLDLAGSLGVLVLAAGLGWSVLTRGPVRSGVLGADAVSVVFVLLIGLLVAAVSIYSLGWMPRELAHRGIRE